MHTNSGSLNTTDTELRNAPTRRELKKRLRLALIFAVVFGLTVWAFYGGLILQSYEVQSGKISSGSVRIAVIADLHSRLWGEDQQPLLDMIAAQQPDIIALPGDIADDGEPLYGAEMFFRGVSDIAPAYYVSGNHEYWTGAYDEIHDMIESHGITVLDNESEALTIGGMRVCLCGIDDPEIFDYTDDPWLLALGSEEALLNRFSDLDSDTYNVLLAHRPEYINAYLQYDFDLILSGHTHGGQVRVPLLVNGLFAPDQGWLPKYAGGRYDFDGTTMIVSRGAGAGNALPRIFDPPEIVVVDISAK